MTRMDQYALEEVLLTTYIDKVKVLLVRVGGGG